MTDHEKLEAMEMEIENLKKQIEYLMPFRDLVLKLENIVLLLTEQHSNTNRIINDLDKKIDLFRSQLYK